MGYFLIQDKFEQLIFIAVKKMMTETYYEDDFQRRLRDYFNGRYIKQLRYLQFCAFLYCISHLIACIITQCRWFIIMLWGVSSVIAPLIIQLLKDTNRTWFRTKKQRILIQIKDKLGWIFLTGLITYFQVNSMINRTTPHIAFIGGLDLIALFLMFRLVFTRWHSFTGLMVVLLVALMIEAGVNKEYPADIKVEIGIRFLAGILIIGVFQYLEDKTFRDLFQMKLHLEDKDILYREMLNMIPESIIILSANLELVYANDCFRTTILNSGSDIGQMDAEKMEELFFRFSQLQEITRLHNQPGEAAKLTDFGPKKSLKEILNSFLEEPLLSPAGDFDTCSFINLQKTQQNITTHQNMTTRSFAHAPRLFQGFYKPVNPSPDFLAGSSQLEHVEIKLTTALFQNQKCILVVVRPAPERGLLKQLEKAAKYKDEIMASVSHELRTPINSNINLINEALKSDAVPHNIKNELLDPAFKSAKLLLNLVNDILDMSQIKERKMKLVSQICDLRKVLNECHYLFEQQCKQKKLNFKVEIDTRVPLKMRTDPNRLTQIVLNLLSNAFKFTFEGEIKISASLVHSGLVKISVSDTGIGIKEEDKKKLMKKFEKIDLGEKAAVNSTGAGLGLMIANSLAILLGPKDSRKGGLRFESEWGKGTTVFFLLKSRQSFSNTYETISALGDKINTSKPQEENLFLLNQNSEVTLGRGKSNKREKGEEYEEEDSSEFFEEEKNEMQVYVFNKFEASRHTSMLGTEGFTPLGTFELGRTTQPDATPGRTPDSKHKKTFFSSQKSLGAQGCGCPKVMVVDDDGFNVLTIETLLKSLNVSSESALSGVECLKRIQEAERCQKRCKRFGLILMDGNMPIKDGLTTTRELIDWNAGLNRPWTLKIVGCTAYESPEKAQEFIDAGAIEHLTKPLNKSALIEVLEKYKIIEVSKPSR